MESSVHTYEDLSLRVFHHKGGDRHLLAFHGFAQRADTFHAALPGFTSAHQVHVIPLPHHTGDEQPSYDPYVNPLSLKTFLRWIETYLEINEIDRFSLLGYSMGAKLALSLTPHFGPRIDRINLYAPDGIYSSLWYKLAVRTGIGHWVFKRVMLGEFLIRMTKVLTQMGIISSSKAALVNKSTHSVAKRRLVYDTWMRLREIRPDLDILISTVQKANIPFEVHLGRYDPVIPAGYLIDWCTSHDQVVKLIMYDCGHNVLSKIKETL